DTPHAPVRRPGGTFIVPAIGDDALAGPVGTHHPDAETAALLFGEGDEIAARAPDGRAVLAAAEADAVRIRTICAHKIDLLRAAAVGFEHDLRAVRREAASRVDAR